MQYDPLKIIEARRTSQARRDRLRCLAQFEIFRFATVESKSLVVDVHPGDRLIGDQQPGGKDIRLQ
jgi:hypothetical protein